MTAKEYLQRFFVLQIELEVKQDEIINLQSMAKNVTTVIRKTPNGSPSAVSRIEKAVVEIENKSRELAAELVRTTEARDEIAFAIEQLENPTERCLLSLRYVFFWEWKEIAKKLNYSEGNIYRLHHKALKNFAALEICNDEETR